MDKLRAIQTFVAVADGRSFAAASRKLNVSAATVTRLIGELETGLGVMLIQRTTRQVTLTDTGKRYLQDVKAIIEELNVADEAAQGAHGTPQGTLRVTSSSMFGNIYLTPIIATYLNLYPDVQVEAILVDRIVNLIEEQIDVSIRIGELQDSSLMATRVGSVQLYTCGSPDYFNARGKPQTPEDLLQHQTVGLQLGNFQAGWKFGNGKIIKPTHRLSFNSIPAAISAAEAGLGLLRVLSYQIAPQINAGSLEHVLQSFTPPPLPINVIHGQGRRTSAKVRSFIDLAVETLRDNTLLN